MEQSQNVQINQCYLWIEYNSIYFKLMKIDRKSFLCCYFFNYDLLMICMCLHTTVNSAKCIGNE